MPLTSKKTLRRTARVILVLFLLINTVAFLHAYRFTHYTDSNGERPKPEKLSFLKKIKAVVMGIENPRPENPGSLPLQFETMVLQSNKKIECWYKKQAGARGTVILFHGYGSCKWQMTDKAAIFFSKGYNVFLADFMGSGGSEGNTTTIGFKEAEQVKSCYDYIDRKGEDSIYLFGTSLGASAILKAVHDYDIKPEAIMIECPFGSLHQAVKMRFRSMGLPAFPMSGLLTFWGGVQHGFNAFAFRPEQYAASVYCPALLMYGQKDQRVSREETDSIYAHLHGRKKLVVFPGAGHENYLNHYAAEWEKEVFAFLDQY